MGNYDTSALNAAFRELFLGRDLTELGYDEGDRPLFTMIEKSDEVGGTSTSIPVSYDDGQGYTTLAGGLTTAQSNTAAAPIEKFEVTTIGLIGVARVDTKAVHLSRNNRGSLVRALDYAMKKGVSGFANMIETALFRTPAGSLGTVVETSGTTITMGTSLRDINNFSKGMKLVFAASETSNLRDSGDSVTVVSVDRDAGTMVVTPDLSSIAGLTTLDCIFREGTYTDASKVSNISGLGAWCPASAPSATLFFNVNRTYDSRLGGFRYTGTSMQIQEALTNGASKLAEEGSGKPDIALMSFQEFRVLIAETGAQVTRSDAPLSKLGFSTIQIHGPKGPIEVVPCAKCPAGHCWVGQRSTLKLLHSPGGVIQVDAEEGNEWKPMATQLGYECRLVFFGNMACTNTAAWCHITL